MIYHYIAEDKQGAHLPACVRADGLKNAEVIARTRCKKFRWKFVRFFKTPEQEMDMDAQKWLEKWYKELKCKWVRDLIGFDATFAAQAELSHLFVASADCYAIEPGNA